MPQASSYSLPKTILREKLATYLDELGPRIPRCLALAGITTIGQLIIFSSEELLKIYGLGRRSVGEIELFLKYRSLALTDGELPAE
jgi:DNA-directed RNA polymerase alpha subunit